MRKRKFSFFLGGGVGYGKCFPRSKEKRFCFEREGYPEVGMSLWTAYCTYVKRSTFRPVRSLTKDGFKKKNENEKENN